MIKKDPKTIIVVDANKLWQLSNFWCKKILNKKVSSPLELIVKELSKKNWELITTEINLKRALKDFEKNLKDLEKNKRKILLNIIEARIKLLIKVISSSDKNYSYLNYLSKAIEILNDQEEEPEDSHLLALAMAIKQKYNKNVIIWTSDKDFYKKEEKILSLGIKLTKKIL